VVADTAAKMAASQQLAGAKMADTAAKMAAAASQGGEVGGGIGVGAWAAALAPLILGSAVPFPFLVAAACRRRSGAGGEGYEMAPLGGDGFLPRHARTGGLRRPRGWPSEQGGWALVAVNMLAVLCLVCVGAYLEFETPGFLQAAFACSFGAGAVWAMFGHLPDPVESVAGGRGVAASARWEDVAANVREEVAHRVAAEVEYLVQIGVSREEAETQIRGRMARLLLHPRRQQPPPEASSVEGESFVGGEPPVPLDVGTVGAMWTEERVRQGGAVEEGINLRSLFEEREIPIPDAYLCPISMVRQDKEGGGPRHNRHSPPAPNLYHQSGFRFCCRTTDFVMACQQEVMIDPVILTDGHVYERKAIERWLLSHDTSPKTNQVVATDQLIPCHALRTVIQDFVESHKHLIDVAQDADEKAELPE